MPLTFYAENNEFAASTGSNVGSGFNSSRFDNPPNGSHDLVITVNPGDTDPRLFGIGDTYDISFGGIGHGTLEDAVVVRSDAAPGGGGVIVFSGANQFGDLTEIVWSPGFDLNGWYWDNYNPSAEPEFYTTDINGAYTHTFVCFAAETRIRVPGGVALAGDLGAGDQVWTLDGGPMPVMWRGQRQQPGLGRAAPVLFLPGTIGNEAPLRLSQQHRVLVQSARAELLCGAPEVFVPAKAMINEHDILLAPCLSITYVHLLLNSHQILNAEGALCESLLLGEMAVDILLHDAGSNRGDGPLPMPQVAYQAARPVLTYAEARVLLADPQATTIPSTTPPAGARKRAGGQRLRRRDMALV